MTQFEKISLSDFNQILKPYGAVISFETSLMQSKADGFIGDAFKDSKKPVFDFDIVGIACGKSYANIYSSIYKKLPKEIKDLKHCSYIETTKRIYI